VLVLELLDLLIGGFIFLFLAVIIVVVHINWIEEVEESFLAHFLGGDLLFACLLILLLLLNDLDSHVFAVLPLNHIAVRLLDILALQEKLLDNFGVAKPLVGREEELDGQVGFFLVLMTFDAFEVLQYLLVFFGDLKSELRVLQSLQPVVLELLGFQVVAPH